MIRPSYALKLATTKLKSKKGLLVASITISSLLFGALIAMIIIYTGVEKSATEFVKKAGNDRYLVKTSPNIPYEKISIPQPLTVETIRDVRVKEKKYYDELKQKYKTLGLKYDESMEISALTPSSYFLESTPLEERVALNWQSPVVDWINNQKFIEYTETANNKFFNLQNLGERYGATGYYKADSPSLIAGIPTLRLVRDGKENFADREPKSEGSTTFGYYTNGIHNGSYGFTDQKLLSRYLLKDTATDLKGVPVVVSAQEAASLFGNEFGIGKEPESSNEKRAWISSVQSKLNGYTYEVCYRNTAEQVLLDKIQRDYAEMKSNESAKDYIKPTLIYQYPTEACGEITIQSDTRSINEIASDKQAINTQTKLDTYVAPSHRSILFEIVGVQYAQPYIETSNSADEYIKNLLVSRDDHSTTLDIPIEMYNDLPDSMKIDDIRSLYNARTTQDLSADDAFTPRVLEFNSVENARKFINTEACPTSVTTCDKEFRASPYGSNYLILDEIGNLFRRIAGIAFPGVLTLAALIIWLTISRIMAENRKETAVYRAMGAKRKDILGIYIIYVLIIALLIAATSIIIGIAGAFTINFLYSQSLTDSAVTAFGIIDTAPQFSMFNLESSFLYITLGSIFAVSLLASIQPLVRNTNRQPVQDIREE